MATQTNESLRSLTLQVISNYRKTTKFATKALLATSRRGFGKVDAALGRYDVKLSDTVEGKLDMTKETILAATNKADEALGKFNGSVKQTLAQTQDSLISAADKADTAVEKLLDDTSKRVAKFPTKGGKLNQLLKNERVKSVENLGIPGAKLLCYLSGKLADGVEQLSNQVSTPAKRSTATRKAVTKKVATPLKAARKAIAKKTTKPVAKQAAVRKPRAAVAVPAAA